MTVGSLEANPEKLFLSEAMAAARRQPSPSGFKGAEEGGVVSSETRVATGMASVGCMYPSFVTLVCCGERRERREKNNMRNG